MQRIEMIGEPLGHVETPGLLNPIFRAEGDALQVVTVEVGLDDLPDYVRRTRLDEAVAGLVVTTPLKLAICRHLDRRTATVELTAAANCIRTAAGSWTGANFDGHGFLRALARVPEVHARESVLVVGCGAAGSAIAAAFIAGPIKLALHDADAAKAHDLKARLQRFAPDSDIDVLAAPLGPFDIVINASPVGMELQDASPIPEETVAVAKVVADIVTAERTELKRTAERLGKPLVLGKDMVGGQIALMRRFFLSEAK